MMPHRRCKGVKKAAKQGKKIVLALNIVFWNRFLREKIIFIYIFQDSAVVRLKIQIKIQFLFKIFEFFSIFSKKIYSIII